MGEQLGNFITSINWTLGIGLSLKRLNDKSPFSLSPFFSWALRRVHCPNPHYNTPQTLLSAILTSKHFRFYVCLDNCIKLALNVTTCSYHNFKMQFVGTMGIWCGTWIHSLAQMIRYTCHEQFLHS